MIYFVAIFGYKDIPAYLDFLKHKQGTVLSFLFTHKYVYVFDKDLTP